MDPWYHHVHQIPRVFINTGYMDDNATGGHGLSWLPETQKLIHQFHSAGFQVLTHSCYRVNPLFACPPVIASLEECSPVIEGFPSTLLRPLVLTSNYAVATNLYPSPHLGSVLRTSSRFPPTLICLRASISAPANANVKRFCFQIFL